MASMKTSKTAAANKRRSATKDPAKSAGETLSKAKLKQKSSAPKVRATKQAAAVKKPTATSKQAPETPTGDRTTKQKGAEKVTPKAEAPRAPLKPKAARASEGDVGVGDRVPAFALSDHTGKTVRSDDLRGKPYVLYFYPKDDTAGCTKEACDFNDDLERFSGLGVEIYGVSPDPVASHDKFRKKYGLGFSLLADVDKQLSTAMGVYQVKKNYGREYLGVVRSTFLIDAEGKVAQAWRAVRVAGHVPAVLERARSL